MGRKRLTILLDIDDTALLTKDRGKTWFEHPLLHKLIKDHNVYLFSGNPDIKNFYVKWKTKGYIPKGSFNLPKADVLIDNNADLHKEEVKLKNIIHLLRCSTQSEKIINYCH